MKITFLGTNGWFDTATGSTVCTLIEAKKCYILLDAGIGIYKADKYIRRDKPVYMFLSHFHHDHMFGLHALQKFNFRSLAIYGPRGTKETVREYLGKKFSVPLKDLPFKTTVTDLDEGWHKSPVKFRCLYLKHVVPCLGFRFELDGKSVSYCTDTGYTRNSVELSRNADLLISECAFLPGKVNTSWPHMNPELAARLAKESGAKNLVLTHFDAEEYTKIEQRLRSENIAKKIFKNTTAAMDCMEINIR